MHESSVVPTQGSPGSRSVWVARAEGRWFWHQAGAELAEPVAVGELIRRLGAPHSASASGPLPTGNFIGRPVAGGLELDSGDSVTFLDAAALNAVDAASAPKHTSRWGLRRSRLLPAPSWSPLRDGTLGDQLLEEGHVTLPLLDTEQVEALRSVYGELHGWSGHDFEPDPGNPDLEYRRRVTEAMRAITDGPLHERFKGVRPLLHSFYCKWPGAQEIALHWDWSCVDEPAGHRSYQVWIALQDTNQDNGHLLLLPRSHRVDSRPRGTALSIPLSDETDAQASAIREVLLPVHLRAGEAVVFDQALIHISSPNTSADERLAAAIVVHDATAQPRYYRRLGRSTAIQYDVDYTWYNSMVPAHLPGEGLDRRPDAIVELEDGTVTTRRLRKLIRDRS